MADFSAFISSIGALSNIAKGLQSIHDEKQIFEATSDLRERIFTIQSNALTLQEDHFSLLKQKDELEKKILSFERWDDTAALYSLKKLKLGAYVYAPNESNKTAEPMHWICAKCYQDRKKSILQFYWDIGKGSYALCPECKNRFDTELAEMQ